MGRSVTLLIMALLSGCSERDLVHPKSSEELEKLAAVNPGLTKACREAVQTEGIGALVHRDDECFEKLPAQRWNGLWERGWEWTNFCPAPAKDCPYAAEHGDIWLEGAEDAYKGPELVDGQYAIEFVGRRTKYPGHFGHLNQYDHLMLVDRIISIRLVRAEPPYPPDSELNLPAETTERVE